MERILTSVKKMLGIMEEYNHFDPDIIMHINSVFGVLTQLGVGPAGGFRIEDDTAEWVDFLDDNMLLETVKTYVSMRVRLMFDPPQNSAVIESMNRIISELEWRINVAVDNASNANSSGTPASDGTRFADRTTHKIYTLYVDNGELMMENEER